MFGDGSTAEQRAARRKRDRSILDSLTGSLSRLRRRRQRGRSRAPRRLHRERPRDRAAAADRDEGVDRRADRHDRAGRRAGDVRRAHQAAVRSAGAGLPGRHHPRRHAALRARPDGPHLSGERSADRRASTAARTTAKIRGGSRSSRRSTSITSRCWRISSRSWRRRRTATARCSIIRWCSTAATWATPNQHVHYDVPHVLVGGANGKLKGGRHLAYPTQDGADRQSAAEHAGQVRHSPGQHRRQHGPAGETVRRSVYETHRCSIGVAWFLVVLLLSIVGALRRRTLRCGRRGDARRQGGGRAR